MIFALRPVFKRGWSPLLPLGWCLAAMTGALTAQYGLSWKPCELCELQRVPLILAGLTALISLHPGHPALVRDGLVRLAAWLLLGTACIAAYHVGVEQHWWIYHGSCNADRQVPVGRADFALALSHPVVVRCDQPPWVWHGLTMAGLNVLFSGLTGLLTFKLHRMEQGL